MRKLLICLLLGLLLPAAAYAEGLRVLFTADVHLGAEAASSQAAADTEALLYRLGQKAEDADALLLLGDVTNNAHPEERERLRTILSAIAAQGVRVYVLPGNHDLSACTAADFAHDLAAFGWDQALSVEESTQSYCAPLAPGWRVLMLNTAQMGEAAGAVGPALLMWVEDMLQAAQAAGERVLVCGHHPLLAHSVNDEKRSDLTAGREALTALLAAADTPVYLAGHRHIAHWAKTAGLTEILAGKTDAWPLEGGELTLSGDALCYRRLPLSAAGEPLAKRSEEAHREKARSMAAAALASTSMAGDAEMIDWFEQVYTAYLCGTLYQQAAEWKAAPAFARWQREEITSIFRPWTAFLMEEMTEDYSTCTIPLH